MFARFDQHIEEGKYSPKILKNGRMHPLHAAIQKYGAENFTCYTLETYLPLYEAQEKEIYWIEEHNTYASGYIRKGYNISRGGEHPDWDPDNFPD